MHREFFARLLDRKPDSHKYDFGHVLVVGGSPGMIGAPWLAAQAAQRAGAGLVSIASTADVIDKIEPRVVETMTCVYSNDSTAFEQLNKFINERKVSHVVVGPGMRSVPLAKQIIAKVDLPMVVDGGALAALHDDISIAAERQIVLTPHTGEFQQFFDASLPDDQLELQSVAEGFARECQLHLVLKGKPTYVAHPSSTVYINQTGNPGMATGGSGDVLAGIIAALCVQSTDFGRAIEAAVYLHGLAGDLAAADKSQPGLIASDLIDYLPKALKQA